jgi:hypothetical protein
MNEFFSAQPSDWKAANINRLADYHLLDKDTRALIQPNVWFRQTPIPYGTFLSKKKVTWQDPEAEVVGEGAGAGAETDKTAAEVALATIRTIAYVVALAVAVALLFAALVVLGVSPLRAIAVALLGFLAWQLEAHASEWYYKNGSN